MGVLRDALFVGVGGRCVGLGGEGGGGRGWACWWLAERFALLCIAYSYDAEEVVVRSGLEVNARCQVEAEV